MCSIEKRADTGKGRVQFHANRCPVRIPLGKAHQSMPMDLLWMPSRMWQSTTQISQRDLSKGGVSNALQYFLDCLPNHFWFVLFGMEVHDLQRLFRSCGTFQCSDGLMTFELRLKCPQAPLRQKAISQAPQHALAMAA